MRGRVGQVGAVDGEVPLSAVCPSVYLRVEPACVASRLVSSRVLCTVRWFTFDDCFAWSSMGAGKQVEEWQCNVRYLGRRKVPYSHLPTTVPRQKGGRGATSGSDGPPVSGRQAERGRGTMRCGRREGGAAWPGEGAGEYPWTGKSDRRGRGERATSGTAACTLAQVRRACCRRCAPAAWNHRERADQSQLLGGDLDPEL